MTCTSPCNTACARRCWTFWASTAPLGLDDGPAADHAVVARVSGVSEGQAGRQDAAKPSWAITSRPSSTTRISSGPAQQRHSAARSSTDYHGARKRLSRAIALTDDPQLLGELYFEMGLTSIYLGDPKTARNFWEKALEYGADNPSLYVNMAGTYEQEENLADAIRLNEIAVERFPDHHKAVVNLARLHAMRGQLGPGHPPVRARPGIAAGRRPAPVRAGRLLPGRRAGPTTPAAEFERAVELDPDERPRQVRPAGTGQSRPRLSGYRRDTEKEALGIVLTGDAT